jgi:hypothetical protein
MSNSFYVAKQTAAGLDCWSCPRRQVLLALCAAIVAMPVKATTEAELARANKPMPHQAVGGDGSTVKVHFTRLDSYLDGRLGNASGLAQLKAQTQQCVREHRETGRPIKPPRAWPDYLLSHRTDLYTSANRTITYQSGLAYALLELDCSLHETAEETAELSSTMGTCIIDLRKKTATGVCDARAHATARARVRVPASSVAEVDEALRKSPDNPGLAALAAVMRQHPVSVKRERKLILGLECEVWDNPFTSQGKDCLSLGGSFTASHLNGEHHQSNMTLETTSVGGIQAHAVQARLDVMVNSAVFAPYLNAGFTITNRAPRK